MAIVLYASANPVEGAVPLIVKGWRNAPDKTIYVRAELMEDEWPGPAMSKARPNKDEVALNAVPNKVTVEFKVKRPQVSELEAVAPSEP